MTRRLMAGFMLALSGLLSAPLLADALVDGAWLEERLARSDVVVLDLRSRIDGGARAAFERAHVPGAVHADYLQAGWRTTVDGVPGMLPPVADLERLIGGFGIANSSHVVIVPAGVSAVDYGAAARVYWTFKVLGHDAVSILDGGHALWVREGRAVESGPSRSPAPATFRAAPRRGLVATAGDVRAALAGGSARLLDNRPRPQFEGTHTAPVVARPGHVPGAVNLPQSRFFDAASGRFASASALRALWRQTAAPRDAPITYCNTGHWAALGWFAASEILGHEGARLYDGSMAEWSADPANPMRTGILPATPARASAASRPLPGN